MQHDSNTPARLTGAWLRRSDQLLAWRIDLKCAGVGPLADPPPGEPGQASEDVTFDPGANHAHASLLAAFDRLGHVSILSPAVAEDVALVLAETVADPREPLPSLPSLEVAPPAPPLRATAANPRAYKGTKARPPKAALPPPLDLRPFLMSSNGLERLTGKLREVTPGFRIPFEAWDAPGSLRLACSFHWREGWTDAERHRLIGLWRQLQGDSVPLLVERLALHMILHASNPASATELLQSILAAPPQWREAVGRGMTMDFDPDPGHAPLAPGLSLHVAALCALGFDDTPEDQREVTLWANRLSRIGGGEPERVVAGARLGVELPYDYIKGHVSPPPVAVTEDIRALMAAFGSESPWTGAGLWSEIEDNEDLMHCVAALRRSLDAGHLTKPALLKLLELPYRAFAFDYEAEWKPPLARTLPTVLAAMAGIEPDYQLRAARLYTEFFWEGIERLGLAVQAIERWCRPPFSTTLQSAYYIELLCALKPESRARVLAAPDEAMLGVEAEVTSENDAVLVACALDSAIEINEAWALDQFLGRPRLFARLLKVLGLLKAPPRENLLRKELAGVPPEPAKSTDLQSLTRRLQGLSLPSGARAIPRAVRDHLDGTRELTPGQVERHADRLREAWPEAFLQHLRMRAIEEMGKSLLPADRSLDAEAQEQLPDQMIHALQFQSSTRRNRPALRRLIRSVLDGDEEYLSRHPRNRRWLKQLAANTSAECARAWAELPSLTRELKGLGRVTIAPECEPLEALRMGTYVGSCYGQGGSFRFAATAVVMDANKHVLFARDAKGTFLARQIMAISFDWTLACYAVYPLQDDTELAFLFGDYNVQVAEVLGVALAVEDGEDVEVQNLVSTYDWDDGIWRPDTDAPEDEDEDA